MSLTPGTRLGPYEIVAPLGAGGMGEVYRARDTRLGRDVAVKVLPQHLSSSPEVRARFEREAKTVSSLNHPHICTLFDVGREGDADYLVMELVEGETLAQRLQKGALPAAEVLKLGAQIADALDRAHRAGVIHRDLKPGNVMLTRSGAKLMDFGLARATGLAGPTSGSGAALTALTQSPMMSQPLTAEGTIVGTFQYMSPEQLEGQEADARSDLWSLGCVLYEMASGRRAFEGRSQASLISSIMTIEPAPLSQVAPVAPPGLERLVRNCLTKDPEERVQTAHDVKLQLQGIAEGGSQASAPTVAPAPARHHGRERLAWAIAGLAAVAALVALALGLLPRGASPRHPVQLSLVPPDHTRLSVYWSSAAISPDGRSVVFAATDANLQVQLWLQQLDAAEATLLPGTQNAMSVFWSPDSQFIGFTDGVDKKLKKIAVGGSSPVTLCTAQRARGGSWNQRGDILVALATQGPLFRVPDGGGEPVQVTTLDPARHEAAHRFPYFLPDGDHFLYAALPPGPEGWDIFVGSLSSKDVRKIMTAKSGVTYAEPGYVLFVRSGKVMAQPFDARSLTLSGSPIALADAPPTSDMDAETIATASRDGKVVFPVGRRPDTELQWLDRSGTVRSTLSLPKAPWGEVRLSPDARYAAVVNGDDIWRVDLARSVASRLTSNGAANLAPIWSPDGSRIAYEVSRVGSEQIHAMNADGSGEARELSTTNDPFKVPEDWTRDGLVFNSLGATLRDLWLIPDSGDGKAAPLLRTPFDEFNGRVSPDGHWIAYLSDEAGPRDVYIQSFPQLGHKTRVSQDGALRMWWMPGGDELCFMRAGAGGTAAVMSVSLRRNGAELEPGEPRLLFNLPALAGAPDFTRDGQRMLVSTPIAGQQTRKLRVIVDWTGLVKR